MSSYTSDAESRIDIYKYAEQKKEKMKSRRCVCVYGGE